MVGNKYRSRSDCRAELLKMIVKVLPGLSRLRLCSIDSDKANICEKFGDSNCNANPVNFNIDILFAHGKRISDDGDSEFDDSQSSRSASPLPLLTHWLRQNQYDSFWRLCLWAHRAMPLQKDETPAQGAAGHR